MPLVTVATTGDHEPFEVRVGGGAHLYTFSANKVVTVFVYPEHLAALTSAITTAIPSAVVTARNE
jgi:hypothetical protein